MTKTELIKALRKFPADMEIEFEIPAKQDSSRGDRFPVEKVISFDYGVHSGFGIVLMVDEEEE